MFNRRYLVSSSNASITIDVIEHCKNMYAGDPTSLFDSTQKLFLFCKRDRPDCQLITFRALRFQHAPELSKEVGCEGKWDGSISPTGLENPFTLMSVSSSVDNQGPVH